MATVLPFRAIRPDAGLEKEIASLPYDVYTRASAKKACAGHPDSFLNIDRPEVAFDENCDMYAADVYAHANNLFKQMLASSKFVEEDKPCYYIYQLKMNDMIQAGIVACSSIWDYKNNIVKKHENTLPVKEQDRIKHIQTLGAQSGPIFLAYKKSTAIESIIKNYQDSCSPFYSFVSDDGVEHTGWIIRDDDDIHSIKRAFDKIPFTYIADGHHRCASACKVGFEMAKNNDCHTGKEDYNYFLSVLFSKDQLHILDYNRVVADLNERSVENFFDKLSKDFVVQKVDKRYRPKSKGSFGMYLENQWYSLEFKSALSGNIVKDLDVSILQDNILCPILNIKDPKIDPRIDFIGGIFGLGKLEQLVDSKQWKVAFSMYPTSMDELISVADANLLMPPKSTWFEPKLRSGLYIHKI